LSIRKKSTITGRHESCAVFLAEPRQVELSGIDTFEPAVRR
jgi:hypothetical protein